MKRTMKEMGQEKIGKREGCNEEGPQGISYEYDLVRKKDEMNRDEEIG